MRPVTLLIVADDEGTLTPDVDGAIDALRRAMPGVSVDRVTILAEHEIGGWLRRHHAERCLSVADVTRTPERKQPVVLDIDLPCEPCGLRPADLN